MISLSSLTLLARKHERMTKLEAGGFTEMKKMMLMK